MTVNLPFRASAKAIAAMAVAASALLGGCAVVPGPYGPHVVGPRVGVAVGGPVYAPAPVYAAPPAYYPAPSYYPAPVYVAPPVVSFSYGRGYYPRYRGWHR
jgi:hypothetical protein